MPVATRSGCPINLAVEVLGDRWSLIILRDVMFGNRRHFRDLLSQSDERISSSILADRLKTLVELEMLSNRDDPTHKQRTTYSLTDKSIALLPVFAQLGAWGRQFLSPSRELSIRARLLEEGGAPMWDRFMTELHREHVLGEAVPYAGSVLETLTDAYLSELERPDAD
jgi:DNA-binding HxlR family transcriptional regulator